MTSVRAIEVVVDAEDVELASDLLWGCGVSAIGETVDDEGRVVLRTDLPADGITPITEALADRWPVEVVQLPDDGLDGWREFAEITRAGRHLVFQPPWLVYEPEPDDVVLLIDPGRSFGHGAHPTTQLCLAAVERLIKPGMSVLDVGCGSGVLAIAAAKLGAVRVEAIDIVAEAIVATSANAAANEVNVAVSARPIGEVAGTFDLIFANIGAVTLRELASQIIERLAPGGNVVLSGLLDDRWRFAADSFAGTTESAHLAVAEVTQADGWAAVVIH